jgi:hypothetical protein
MEAAADQNSTTTPTEGTIGMRESVAPETRPAAATLYSHYVFRVCSGASHYQVAG